MASQNLPALPAAAVENSDREPVSNLVKIVNILGICLPFAGLIVAIVSLWGHGFSWLHMSLLLGMYVVSALGITVGYHRLFTHRSFETYRVVKCILAIFGAMAIEGPMLKWVAMHRRHHQHSDGKGDPHSPHLKGEALLGVLRGFWHAHIGWIFEGDPKDLYRYVGDLWRDRAVRTMSNLWMVWAVLGLLIPTALGGLITMSWTGALLGFVWGGLARVFLIHHVTWSINSVCHLWGTRPFDSRDESRNNLIFGVVGLGEGWHNNHHAFPTSARHGLRWWQFDASYLVIRALAALGLAWKVRLPSAAAMQAKALGA